MTIKEIVKEYLSNNGYDGLFSDIIDCGCEISDLMPCCYEGIENCESGYKYCRKGDNRNWVILRSKEGCDGNKS
jgi:hypothetical protein